MRTCNGCGRNRDERFFPPDARRTDGLSLRCQACSNKAKAKSRRQSWVKATYGLSPEHYRALVAAQDNRCAICGGQREYNLDVDHCHKCSAVRGLLCRYCNRYLLPGGRPDVLRAAADYLEAHWATHPAA